MLCLIMISGPKIFEYLQLLYKLFVPIGVTNYNNTIIVSVNQTDTKINFISLIIKFYNLYKTFTRKLINNNIL